MEYKIPTSKIIELLDLWLMFISSSIKTKPQHHEMAVENESIEAMAMHSMECEKIPHQFSYSIVMEIMRIVQ